MPHLLVQYSYLQILDFLTTLTFLLYGVQEANPIVQWFLDQTPSPVYGLIAVKMIAVALGIWSGGSAGCACSPASTFYSP